MTRRRPSLQRRLLVGVIGLVALVWLGMAAYTAVDVRHELDELLDGHLAQAAALLVVQQMEEIEEDHEIQAPTLHRYAPRVAFQVWHEGRLVLRSADAPDQPMGDTGRRFEAGFRSVRIGNTDWRVFAAEGPERDVKVFVGEQDASRWDILKAVLRGMLAPMALALPLLALVGWWGVRVGLAPLRHMGEALHTRDPRALQPVTLPDATAEMTPMLDALNGLFERIGALMEAERRFTADAAHELRTPIAAIRTQAQVALGESGDAERRHALLATLEGCDRATRLVEQLLTLSRLEAADAPLSGTVDLAALARRTAADLAPKAVARQQDLSLEVDAPDGAAVALRGDDTLTGVLLRNLLDNALRYSPDGAQIRLSVSQVDGRAQLVVEDSGPGLEAAERQRLGERFFRVLGTQASGSGLGWSIVRRIAQVHAAVVETDRSPTLGGLRVTVRWPAAGSA
jgi:two-component system, OmpR family, sensor histidine kinase QseC